MNKKELVLSALASGKGESFSPVQVQKMFFLIDKNISMLLQGPFFNFEPYNYGPFDKGVYDTLEELSNDGLVEIISNHNWREYRLTERGQSLGESFLSKIPESAKDYILRVSEFVRKLTFAQLVSAIYKAYPEMKEKSVFQE